MLRDHSLPYVLYIRRWKSSVSRQTDCWSSPCKVVATQQRECRRLVFGPRDAAGSAVWEEWWYCRRRSRMHDRDRSSTRLHATPVDSGRRMASNFRSWAPSRSQSLKSMVATNIVLESGPVSEALLPRRLYRARRDSKGAVVTPTRSSGTRLDAASVTTALPTAIEAHMAFRQSHTPYFSASARFSALRFPLTVLCVQRTLNSNITCFA